MTQAIFDNLHSLCYSPKQNNILIPFTEITESNSNTVKVNYQSIIFNPILTKKDWMQPK